MAVTAAQARQALAKRGFQEGELAGDQQENKSVRRSLPCCSFDGYYNLISAHHV